MAVLLVGSIGNGKSTLGNFLLNPHEDHIFGKKQTFKTAQTSRPETQHVLGEDTKRIQSYEGEITGYNKRLQQMNEKAKEALQKTQRKEQEITDKEKCLEHFNSNLKVYDSSNSNGVIANSWNLKRDGSCGR